MQLLTLLTIVLLISCSQSLTEEAWKDTEIENTTPDKNWSYYENPEEAGWSNEKLNLAKKEFNLNGASALMVVYKGRVLLDWGSTARKFDVRSIRKSLLSAVIGTYHDKGKLNLNKTLNELGINDKDSLSDQEKEARFIDLLKYRSGVYHPTTQVGQSTLKQRPSRGSYKPNEHFFYNHWDVHASKRILENETGKSFRTSFNERLAKPLQFQDYSMSDHWAVIDSNLSHIPGYSLRMSARDLARVGQLYLTKGKWKQKQILSEEWITKSTTQYSLDKKKGLGMGYMWQIIPKKLLRDMGSVVSKYSVFAATGRGAQVVMVIPELDLVIVLRSNLYLDMYQKDDNIILHAQHLKQKPMFKILNHIFAAKINLAKESTRYIIKKEPKKYATISDEYVGIYPYNLFKSFQIIKNKHGLFTLEGGTDFMWKSDLYKKSENIILTEDTNVSIIWSIVVSYG
jgi:CubicO group peptidase (beta-lactamase class C family)